MSKRHLVRTIEDCSFITRIFKTKKSMKDFIDDFKDKYQGKEMDGYWVDLVITDIHGSIVDDSKVIK